MNPGEFLVEGRGLVFGGLKPEDLGQPAGASIMASATFGDFE
jgi:hypothetical protein